jgi:phosphatidylserine decarboxylase
LDVYGENVRVIVPIDTEHFGRMMVVCVGAMMVGSTVITAKKGQKVRRTDELGYFKFGILQNLSETDFKGGSTIILLFQPGTFVFDDDLVANSKESLETLVFIPLMSMLMIASSGSEYWTSSSYSTSCK